MDAPTVQFGLALLDRLVSETRRGGVTWRTNRQGMKLTQFETLSLTFDPTGRPLALVLVGQDGETAARLSADALAPNDPAEQGRVELMLSSLAELLQPRLRPQSAGLERPSAPQPAAPVIPRSSVDAAPPEPPRAEALNVGLRQRLAQALCRHRWAASRSQPGTDVCLKCRVRRGGAVI